MHVSAISSTADLARFARAVAPVSAPRKPQLAGDARPGDVITLAGGALVRDANGNGLVDREDSIVGPCACWAPPLRVDVRG